jgi:hypothetical protein
MTVKGDFKRWGGNQGMSQTAKIVIGPNESDSSTSVEVAGVDLVKKLMVRSIRVELGHQATGGVTIVHLEVEAQILSGFSERVILPEPALVLLAEWAGYRLVKR